MTDHRILTRVTPQVELVEQEMLIFPEEMKWSSAYFSVKCIVDLDCIYVPFLVYCMF